MRSLLLLVVGIACAGLSARAQETIAPGARLGGPATVLDASVDAFGYPAPILTRTQRRAFMVGNSFFRNNWVEAPASTTARDGLGPLFNARSCGGCHLRDGRGRPPAPEENGVTGFLVRLGRSEKLGGGPHPVYGNQLQDRAVSGVVPEGRLVIKQEPVRGRYADGEEWELSRPLYSLADDGYGRLDPSTRFSGRVAPQVIGLGLLEAVPDATLEKLADPEDVDGDGISGRVSRIKGPQGLRIGRFGWKAAMPTVREQTAAAFVNDMGITTPVFPDEIPTATQRRSMKFTSGGSPELDERRLDRVTLYGLALAVPARRGVDRPEVVKGEALFSSLGCATCHQPRLETGADSPIEGFRRQSFQPYTDLLLHDMGEELADGVREGGAGPREWRTPPLWGIGLIPVVNGHTHYLHDGRARNLTEAVLWHGGEAQASRDRFIALERGDRAALIAFLESL